MRIISYIAVLSLAAITLVLLFTSKRAAKFFYKTAEPSDKEIINIKLFALALCIADFAAAVILF